MLAQAIERAGSTEASAVARTLEGQRYDAAARWAAASNSMRAARPPVHPAAGSRRDTDRPAPRRAPSDMKRGYGFRTLRCDLRRQATRNKPTRCSGAPVSDEPACDRRTSGSEIREVANAGLGPQRRWPSGLARATRVTPALVRRGRGSRCETGETFYAQPPARRAARSPSRLRLGPARAARCRAHAVTSSGVNAMLLAGAGARRGPATMVAVACRCGPT